MATSTLEAPRDGAALQAAAYRTKEFADGEDRALWTAAWVAVGLTQQIPEAGDLLPYTVGDHGIHVQRAVDGRLLGRFNKAQHGGCRTIPAQCQRGVKTKCSYTSCGYSRDRRVIATAELEESQRYAHQYLGMVPERLLSVAVKTWGSVIWVNLDPHGPPPFALPGAGLPTLEPWFANATTLVVDEWLEVEANWKLAAGSVLAPLGSPTAPGPQGLVWQKISLAPWAFAEGLGLPPLGAREAWALWAFPNLALIALPSQVVTVVTQPTGLETSL
ncbi:MAG: hypothetical protein ACFCBW_14285, partial [Candidatus Competibacterales bacterium]